MIAEIWTDKREEENLSCRWHNAIWNPITDYVSLRYRFDCKMIKWFFPSHLPKNNSVPRILFIEIWSECLGLLSWDRIVEMIKRIHRTWHDWQTIPFLREECCKKILSCKHPFCWHIFFKNLQLIVSVIKISKSCFKLMLSLYPFKININYKMCIYFPLITPNKKTRDIIDNQNPITNFRDKIDEYNLAHDVLGLRRALSTGNVECSNLWLYL